MPRISAGLLLYRYAGDDSHLEVFLVHPGGPFFARKDLGSWGIPKGELDGTENELAAARREFHEETGFVVPPDAPLLALQPVRLRSGKFVHAWAVHHDVDPDLLVSNTCEIAWPPRSGRTMEIPEVDRGGWFDVPAVRDKIAPAQLPLVEELAKQLGAK
jgi:predicted NUDIX family NTP pyrophosphohydrolase